MANFRVVIQMNTGTSKSAVGRQRILLIPDKICLFWKTLQAGGARTSTHDTEVEFP
jgi:hypothetical protein